MKLSHIVAASRNGCIGKDGGMPWHLKADLKHFRRITEGHIVIMGRKTFESIGKPLRKRFNIVISRQEQLELPGAAVVSHLDQAMSLAQKHQADWSEEVFIIGGGEVYRQSIDLTQRIYLTRIDYDIAGDTSYSDPATSGFQRISAEEPIQEGDWRFWFEVWQRPQ